jgi:hypothetical protein
MKIHIHRSLSDVVPELTYILKLLAKNKQTSIETALEDDQTIPSIGVEGSGSTIEISPAFVDLSLRATKLNADGFFELENRKPDYLSTAFFCVTAMQEFEDKDHDRLQRFQYKNSYQFAIDNIKKNTVQICFDKIAEALKIKAAPFVSTFFLSHDIDTIGGALLEDGFNVAKKGRIDLLLKLIFHVATGRPDWFNIDKILKIESEYDCRSTFFWIVNRGKVGRDENADYTFSSNRIQSSLLAVMAHGSENGLHKSLSHESMIQEVKKYGTLPVANRYHYLKFNLPQGFEAVEEAGIKLDASLGFSEQMGFRNNYGLPFNPFNFKTREPFSFVEAPLHIMDRTFFHKGLAPSEIEKEIFAFFEDHRENCVLSILWHNNFFSEYKYKGYLPLYKKILAYIRENSKTITQTEIIEKFNII